MKICNFETGFAIALVATAEVVPRAKRQWCLVGQWEIRRLGFLNISDPLLITSVAFLQVDIKYDANLNKMIDSIIMYIKLKAPAGA